MTDYKIVESSDVIEDTASNGFKKFWQGHRVVDDAGHYYTRSAAWRELVETDPHDNDNKYVRGLSKVTWSMPYLSKPMNVGKANETTSESQSKLEFSSMVKKQRDKRESVKPLPMLAHKFTDKKDKLKYPVYVQPKYDGMRVLSDGEDAWSRGNKAILPEVFAHLRFDTKGYIVDGELLHPGNLKVSEVMRLAKKYRKGETEQLVYVVYDIVDDKLSFKDRDDILREIINAAHKDNEHVVLAELHEAESEAEVLKWHNDFVGRTYEGSIIRTMDGMYKINKRSADLLKYKDFIDEEFQIVDIFDGGHGSYKGLGMFRCVAKNGDEFKCTPEGTAEQRREYLTNRENYIGKWAKIRYRELTEYGVPFHGVVVEVRDSADFKTDD